MDKYGEIALLENSDKIRAFLRGFADKLNKVWKNSETDDEEAKTLKRYRALLVFRKRIRELANDMIEHCSDLIEERRSMMLEDYFYVRKSLDDYGLYSIKHSPPIWTKCIYLIQRNLDDVRIYEKELHEDRKKFAERIMRFADKFVDELKGEKGDAGEEEKKQLDSFKTYLFVCFSFEFRLCWRMVCFPTEPQEGEHLNPRVLEQSLNVVCLYIALKNETEELKEYAELNGWKLTEAGPKAKKTKQPREVFTERAKAYFVNAEKAGYLEKVGDKYKWIYCGGRVVALVYFFIRIYEPESPPYEQLKPLFGIKGITSSRSNLVNSDWYKDELKRQKMTPEELKLEERMQKLRKPAGWFPELKNFFD